MVDGSERSPYPTANEIADTCPGVSVLETVSVERNIHQVPSFLDPDEANPDTPPPIRPATLLDLRNYNILFSVLRAGKKPIDHDQCSPESCH